MVSRSSYAIDAQDCCMRHSLQAEKVKIDAKVLACAERDALESESEDQVTDDLSDIMQGESSDEASGISGDLDLFDEADSDRSDVEADVGNSEAASSGTGEEADASPSAIAGTDPGHNASMPPCNCTRHRDAYYGFISFKTRRILCALMHFCHDYRNSSF